MSRSNRKNRINISLMQGRWGSKEKSEPGDHTHTHTHRGQVHRSIDIVSVQTRAGKTESIYPTYGAGLLPPRVSTRPTKMSEKK